MEKGETHDTVDDSSDTSDSTRRPLAPAFRSLEGVVPDSPIQPLEEAIPAEALTATTETETAVEAPASQLAVEAPAARPATEAPVTPTLPAKRSAIRRHADAVVLAVALVCGGTWWGHRSYQKHEQAKVIAELSERALLEELPRSLADALARNIAFLEKRIAEPGDMKPLRTYQISLMLNDRVVEPVLADGDGVRFQYEETGKGAYHFLQEETFWRFVVDKDDDEKPKIFFDTDDFYLLIEEDSDWLQCDGDGALRDCDLKYEQILVRFEKGAGGKVVALDLIPMAKVTPAFGNAHLGDTKKLEEKDYGDLFEKLNALLETKARYEAALKKHEAYVEKLAKSLKTDRKFSRKLQSATVKLDLLEDSGGIGGCSGAIVDDHTILTAKHCVTNLANNNFRLVDGVWALQGEDHLRARRLMGRASRKSYAIAAKPSNDTAVIYFKNRVFKRRPRMVIADTSASEGETYFAGHQLDYDNATWVVSSGTLGHCDRSLCKFNFGAQRGNSGGPIVDVGGNVVSVFSLGDNYGHSFGPSITQANVNALIEEARAKLKGAANKRKH